MEVAKALEGVKGDAVIDGELVAIGKDGVSHFQLLQNALRHEAKLKYCAFDLMFENAVDLRKQPRAKELQMRCHAAKAVTPERRFIVGIAMDALDVKGSSEDFICLYTGDWTAKDTRRRSNCGPTWDIYGAAGNGSTQTILGRCGNLSASRS